MNTIPACHKEFGLKVRYHVPQVHAMLADPDVAARTVVEIEAGDEALYPRAVHTRIVPRGHDDERRGKPRTVYHEEERFVPRPLREHPEMECAVVVCPRWRKYGSAKNWPMWSELTKALAAKYWVTAAGAPDSSVHVPVPATWQCDRFLDATICAMRNAVVVATDAGLAHLAVLMGRPLVIITAGGLVAPGPQLDPEGEVLKDAYWPVRFDEYYAKANHMNAPITMVDGWNDLDAVVAAVEAML